MHASLKSFLALTTALVAVPLLAVAPAKAEVPQEFINAQTGTTYTMLLSDCGKMVTFSNAAAVAVTLPQAGTAGKFFAGCFVDVQNKGVGTVTITPTTSTINAHTTLVLTTGQGAKIVSDSTNYQTQLGSGLAQGNPICVGTSAAKECDGLVGQVVLGTLTLAGLTGQAVLNTFTNTFVGVNSMVMCQLQSYSGSFGVNGIPSLSACNLATLGITAAIANVGTAALNGVITIDFIVLKP